VPLDDDALSRPGSGRHCGSRREEEMLWGKEGFKSRGEGLATVVWISEGGANCK